MITEWVRYSILLGYRLSGRIAFLINRMLITEVGQTGSVSSLDERVAKEHKIKKLNRFEKWLLVPVIELEKRRRQECWRQSVRDIMYYGREH